MKGRMEPKPLYEGATKMPFDLPALRSIGFRRTAPCRVLWWRLFRQHSHTGYATEVFVWINCSRQGKNPVQDVLDLMKSATQVRTVAC